MTQRLFGSKPSAMLSSPEIICQLSFLSFTKLLRVLHPITQLRPSVYSSAILQVQACVVSEGYQVREEVLMFQVPSGQKSWGRGHEW